VWAVTGVTVDEGVDVVRCEGTAADFLLTTAAETLGASDATTVRELATRATAARKREKTTKSREPPLASRCSIYKY